MSLVKALYNYLSYMCNVVRFTHWFTTLQISFLMFDLHLNVWFFFAKDDGSITLNFFLINKIKILKEIMIGYSMLCC